MTRERLTCGEVAARVGCDTSTISRLIARPGKKQVRKPSLSLATRLAGVTKGEVTANDFVDTA